MSRIKFVSLMFTFMCGLFLYSGLFATTIEVETGNLKIGGIVQAQYDSTRDLNPPDTFILKRARLFFKGEIIPSKVNYFLQFDGAEKGADDNFLLDAKLMLNYIPKTEVAIGRFVPPFTYYMPRTVADLDFINYPLIVSKYGMFRQVGVQTTTKLDNMALPLEINLGVFNGPTNNWIDDNLSKDFLARIVFKPMKDLNVDIYHWNGAAVSGVFTSLDKVRTGIGINYLYKNVKMVGEYMLAKDEVASGTLISEIKSAGYYANVGYKIMSKLELLVRYDFYDPNTDTVDNAQDWVSFGSNYFLEGNKVKISLNYVVKNEQGPVEITNNEVVGQAQFSF